MSRGGRGSAQVRRILSEGRRVEGDRVILWIAPGSGAVAAIAGRRIGGAVRRNRARRILRAAWRDIASRVQEGSDIVLVARKSIRGAKTEGLIEEIAGLCRRAGVSRS